MARRRPARSRTQRARFVLIVAVLLFIISISTIVRLYTDLLWYREVGFSSVFFGTIKSQLLLAGVFGAFFFVFAFVNFAIVGRVMPVYRLAAGPEDSFERYRGALMPYLRAVAIGGSAFLAVIFALGVTPLWEGFVLARNAVPFGIDDPQFQRDLSFYVFKLPVYKYVYNWLFSTFAVVTILVAAAHYVTGGIRIQSVGDRVTPQVKAHLSVLIGLLALTRAWGYRLDQFGLLFSERGSVTGASYTDVHAELPALQLLVIISVISAVLFLVNIRIRGWMLPLVAVGLWLLVSILAAGIYPAIVQRFTVEPAEIQKERPFLARNIEATRNAYNLEGIEVQEFSAQPGIDREAVESNEATIDAIRLWDPETLKTAYRQLQSIRPYYQFHDVDVDRYEIEGQRRQVLLSVRELELERLGVQSWQNRHLVYTHGYGLVASPTNESRDEGRPTLMVQGVPPQTDVPALEVKQGGVYFGEAIGNLAYSIVNTKQRELDYAVSEERQSTKYVNYAGDAGVRLSGFLRRLAFAWRFRDPNLVISGLIEPDSRVIFYRQVRERIQKAAPFLEFDGDPYAVVVDGRIFWVQDAYTVSHMYPYSERVDFATRTLLRGGDAGPSAGPSITGDYNYVRNSVKVTLDAYNGTMKFYVWDEKDPIVSAWRKVFPALFENRSEMPKSLLDHVRFPEDLFRVQTHIYQRYHMTDPQEFYTNEDLWRIPVDPSQGPQPLGDELQPYYVMMRPPGASDLEYVQILPMNARNLPNMVSLLVAKSDAADYGKLLDLRFPRGRQIFGVGQIHSRINADERISSTRTLLGQRGSSVIFGNLLVIPVGNSILYSQPLFLQATDESIPELKYVILATSDRVVMQPTLEEALRVLLEGGPEVAPIADETLSEQQAIQEALQHFRAAETALRSGDLAGYQREIEAARRALERSGEQASPSPSPSPTG